MRGRTWLAAILMVLFLISPLVFSGRSAQAQQPVGTITSYRVSGSLNFADPGSEQFWSAIPWTNVSLAASVSPGGGHTSNVEVKSANDGFNIFMLYRWTDSNPSYLADNELFRAANGSLEPLTPALTQNVTQLYYNSTYYYPDRVAMLWSVGGNSSMQQSPQMQLGSDGAITGGAAEIWHWQSNPTDNSPNDTGFPGGYTDPAGKPIYPMDNLSFAEDDYTNTTGFFVIGGSFGQSAPNLAPYSSPYEVLVGNQYSAANKTWTVEMARAFTTDASQYRVQLAPGSTYYAAFAVWQGALGESLDMKSVSQWYGVTIGTAPASAPAAATGGVAPLLAASVALATLLVGIVVGIALRAPPKQRG
jgi:hypothetical protein